MSIFRKRTRRKETIADLAEFVFSTKGDKSSASSRVRDEDGIHRIVFQVYNEEVTPYQVNLYKDIVANWKQLAARIGNGQKFDEQLTLERIFIRDIYDKQTSIICEITTNHFELEMERDNELFKDLARQ